MTAVRSGPLRSLKMFMVGVLFFLWAAGLGFFYQHVIFLKKIPPCSLLENKAVNRGGVVFTGSAGRISTGIRLLNQGAFSKLLVSGITPDLYPFFRKHVVGKHQKNSLALGFRAHNTYGNVEEAQHWIQAHNLNHIVLVTADYHMPRAYFLLNKRCPGICIEKYPVSSELRVQLFQGFYEYHKFIWTVLFPKSWCLKRRSA